MMMMINLHRSEVTIFQYNDKMTMVITITAKINIA